MNERQAQQTRVIQEDMEKSAKSVFSDNEIRHLRVLVRIAVQFNAYLESGQSPRPHGFDDLIYEVDSILINIESFRSVTRSYGVLAGAISSQINWKGLNFANLKEKLLAEYRRFVSESQFERKCRLLLDVFKLQLCFAGIFYDCGG